MNTEAALKKKQVLHSWSGRGMYLTNNLHDFTNGLNNRALSGSCACDRLGHRDGFLLETLLVHHDGLLYGLGCEALHTHNALILRENYIADFVRIVVITKRRRVGGAGVRVVTKRCFAGRGGERAVHAVARSAIHRGTRSEQDSKQEISESLQAANSALQASPAQLVYSRSALTSRLDGSAQRNYLYWLAGSGRFSMEQECFHLDLYEGRRYSTDCHGVSRFMRHKLQNFGYSFLVVKPHTSGSFFRRSVPEFS